jgi:hypothetical protein
LAIIRWEHEIVLINPPFGEESSVTLPDPDVIAQRVKSGSDLHFPHLSGCGNRIRGQKDRRYVGRYDTSHKKIGYGGQPAVLVSPVSFWRWFDQSIQEMS